MGRALVVLAVSWLGSCRATPEPTVTHTPSAAVAPALEAAPALSGADQWVTNYDPEQAANGYTLAFYRRRLPILLDMNGHVVHAWPDARVKSRLRLLPDGSLLGLGLGPAVFQYSWDGDLVWSYRVSDGLPHHDVVRLDNGNTVVLVQPDGRVTDLIREVDTDAEVVWEWDSADHLGRWFEDQAVPRTHMNSVQALPDNRWFADGDERFRPGNLLVSARDLNLVFVIDKTTGEVVWTWDADLDRQHEALMVPPNWPSGGSIQVFNNRLRSYETDRQSAVIEIDPVRREVGWSFREPGFFSNTGGLEQPLANGNVFVASTRGGRAFEVNRGGEIVWQWVPPYQPVRPQRYQADHAPQLAELEQRPRRPVKPPDGWRHVDRRSYTFVDRGDRDRHTIAGVERTVLARDSICRQLLLPAEPSLELSYGLDSALAAKHAPGVPIRFTASLTPDGGPRVELVDDRIEPNENDETWWTLRSSLDRFALQPVELCVAVAGARSDGPRVAFWSPPRIVDTSRAVEPLDRRDELDGLTAEETEARERHLETLGYVN